MWDIIFDLLAAVGSAPDISGLSSKPAEPSFVGGVVTALIFALLAGACGAVAFVPDAWWARALILLLAGLIGLLAFGLLYWAVTDRRRRRRAGQVGFPVVPNGKQAGNDRAGDGPALS